MISRSGRQRRVLWLDSHPKSRGHIISSVDGVETGSNVEVQRPKKSTGECVFLFSFQFPFSSEGWGREILGVNRVDRI